MAVINGFTPPPYMEVGSKGPHVDPWLEFLIERGFGEGILVDGEFGETGSKRNADFQAAHGLKVEGGVGPEMRAYAKDKLGFDFEAKCRSIRGVTAFRQPDGTDVNWSSDQPEPSA